MCDDKHEIKLNRSQEFAYNIMKKGHNIFLSGDPGTGKSFLINKFVSDMKDAGKNVLVTATTGLAAINVGGSTVHRAFHVPINVILEAPSNIPEAIMMSDIIIIEEIGMCRFDVFNYVGCIIKEANTKRAERHKEPIQLIVCGDFYQLPPVLTGDDRQILEQHYGVKIYSSYAFLSAFWNYFNFKFILLTEFMRQKDSRFTELLHRARNGDTGTCVSFNYNCYKGSLIPYAVNLYGTNKKATEKNNIELANLPGVEAIYTSIISGDVKDSDKLVPDTLKFKVGARVMSVVNDSNGVYSNGSFGTVVALHTDSVTVLFDNGPTCLIEGNDWEIFKPKYDAVLGKVEQQKIGTYHQIPLKLAYAITIHKSQGQTYDAVNIDPFSWDCGQLYTALSRCKELEFIRLTQEIKPQWLLTSQDVINFYSNTHWLTIDNTNMEE